MNKLKQIEKLKSFLDKKNFSVSGEYASLYIMLDDTIKKDRKLFKDLAKINPEILIFSSYEILRDAEFINEIIVDNPMLIKKLPVNIWDDNNFCKNFLRINLKYFQYFPKELQNQERYLQEALNDLNNLNYVDNPLSKNVFEIIENKIFQTPDSFNQIPKFLRDNKNFVLTLLKRAGSIYPMINENFKTNKNLIIAINNDINAIIEVEKLSDSDKLEVYEGIKSLFSSNLLFLINDNYNEYLSLKRQKELFNVIDDKNNIKNNKKKI